MSVAGLEVVPQWVVAGARGASPVLPLYSGPRWLVLTYQLPRLPGSLDPAPEAPGPRWGPLWAS